MCGSRGARLPRDQRHTASSARTTAVTVAAAAGEAARPADTVQGGASARQLRAVESERGGGGVRERQKESMCQRVDAGARERERAYIYIYICVCVCVCVCACARANMTLEYIGA